MDMSTDIGAVHAASQPVSRSAGQCVDNVDYALANGPQCPQCVCVAWRGVAWRGVAWVQSVDNVGTLDHSFKLHGYNTVYSYCIHFYF